MKYKGSGTKDYCYYKAVKIYGNKTSAYRSGFISKCRKNRMNSGGIFNKEKNEGLKGWFSRTSKVNGKVIKGWVDCLSKTECGGKKAGTKRLCRPTLKDCPNKNKLMKITKRKKMGKPVKWFMGGINPGSSSLSGMGSVLISQAPSLINNPNAPQATTTQMIGRQVGNIAADAIIPGLGTTLQIGQQFADKLGKKICDPVTGECVDDSSEAAKFGKLVLDPVGSLTKGFEDLFSGNTKEKQERLKQEILRRMRQRNKSI